MPQGRLTGAPSTFLLLRSSRGLEVLSLCDTPDLERPSKGADTDTKFAGACPAKDCWYNNKAPVAPASSAREPLRSGALHSIAVLQEIGRAHV